MATVFKHITYIHIATMINKSSWYFGAVTNDKSMFVVGNEMNLPGALFPLLARR